MNVWVDGRAAPKRAAGGGSAARRRRTPRGRIARRAKTHGDSSVGGWHGPEDHPEAPRGPGGLCTRIRTAGFVRYASGISSSSTISTASGWAPARIACSRASAQASSSAASRPPGPGWKIRSTWPLTEAIAAPIALATSKCSGRWTSLTPGSSVRDEDAAAADDDQRPVARGGLDPVDRVGQRGVGPGEGGPRSVAVRHRRPRRRRAPRGGRDRGVGQRRRRAAEDERLPASR